MSELRVVESFREDLIAAAPKRRRRPRWLLGGVGAIVVVTGIATAATGSFPIGAPLHQDGPGFGGKPVPNSAKLQVIRAADPDGGPEWGLRVFATTRKPDIRHIPPPPGSRIRHPILLYMGNGTCEQIGRIVDGKLGVIETDGRFHALPVGPAHACEFTSGPGRPTLKPRSFVGGGTIDATSSGAPPTGYPNVPCDCAGRHRVVLWGVAPDGVVAVKIGDHRYPVVQSRYLVVLKTRPRAHLMFVLSNGRVVRNPLAVMRHR